MLVFTFMLITLNAQTSSAIIELSKNKKKKNQILYV